MEGKEINEGTVFEFKKNVSVLCHLKVGDNVIVQGWGLALDNKPAIIEDISFHVGCESNIKVKINIYPSKIDSGWITKL